MQERRQALEEAYKIDLSAKPGSKDGQVSNGGCEPSVGGDGHEIVAALYRSVTACVSTFEITVSHFILIILL